MSAGDKWSLPGGHAALEVSGSTRDVLMVCVIPPGWAWPKPPMAVPRELCTKLPSRYLHGAVPAADYREACCG